MITKQWAYLSIGLLGILLTACFRPVPQSNPNLFIPTPNAISIPGNAVVITDAQGPNDEPGQKDLTQLAFVANELVAWSWDETDVWSGANTGDACTLFDTDDDGNANYSLCVQLGDSATGEAVFLGTILYSCGDARADRCTQPVDEVKSWLADDANNPCSVDIVNTDPFPSGDDAPNDTQAACDLNTVLPLMTVGTSEPDLINVCSYPSGRPNSDPSDCVAEPDSGFITVIKDATPDNTNTTFSFTLNGNPFTSITDSGQYSDSATPGSYTLAETLVAGWSLDSISCTSSRGSTLNESGADVNDGVTFTLNKGESWSCTFSNTKDLEPAKIIIEKVTDGGNATFSFSGDLGNFDITTVNTKGSYTAEGLNPGTYSVVENDLAAWQLVSSSCDNGDTPDAINLEAGDIITCTFTNTKLPAPGTIKIVKVVENGLGNDTFNFTSNTLPQNSFSITVTQDMESREFSGLSAGTYDVSETVPNGWELVSSECSDGSNPKQIRLADGESIVCTFTNRRIPEPSSITIKKVALGGNSFFLFESNIAGNFQLITSGGSAQRTFDVSAGTYSVVETPVPAGWELLSATCSDGSPVTAIKLDEGENITCTFTNEKVDLGSITIVKKTKNGDGVFTFNSSTLNASTFSLQTLNGTAQRVFEGLQTGVYDVSEDIKAGWDLESATCSDGSNPTAIMLAKNEEVTCTFINIRQPDPGTIKIVKHSIGGNGSFDFTGSLGSFNLTTSGGMASKSFSVIAGVKHTVAETVPSGWDLTSSSCSNGDSPSAVSAGENEEVVCTFVNTKEVLPSSITIIKMTENGNGSFDFTSSTLGSFRLTTIGGVDSKTFTNLSAGSYDVAETLPTDWELESANCDDGSSISQIDLSEGEHITCTFKNVMIRKGSITIKKIAYDFNGDFDFTSKTLGNFIISIQSSKGGGMASKTFDNLDAGTYDVTEKSETGWILKQITCSDGSDPSNIQLSPGENVTCTFVNVPDC